MTKKKRERLEQAADLRLESQIGEEEGFWDLIRRMARENKTAVISFAVIVLMILAASLAPFLTPYEENDMDLLHRLSPPSAEHLLGTDEGGRDVLTRLLYGARVSLLIGVVPALLSLALGSALGVLAGYRGGLTDAIIMRLADVTLAFPSMLLAMVIMYSLGGGIVDVFLTLTLVNWANVARVVRAQTLQLKSSEYVEAAQVIGVSRATVMRRHILPNCLSTMLVLFTLNVPASILTESSLSFLGLGVQPPNASWGLMINVGRQYLYTAPWLCFAPGAAIMLIVLAFNFLGNGLLDVLDPRLKKQ
ncbi:MAG: ABC transporter permease [Oscillospiraceae bacterium]|jgi:peptide/nickel transport system permease protein/oligopeptide transport system permease protein|nr:ABC transporter permease [Oscillospiraceae bacterium]MBQ2159123.1 ABC transporter permease [Oscillospiraceae bacterium]MBQ4017455.1 ABC transporter permease [Oscillospiraceae bacterium]MBQ5426971.1 ABC transporter permease [Oscillospiraceae bacterium]